MEELLGRISSREIAEWAAFEKVYGPLGLERGDWQAALVAWSLAGAKDSKVSDFLLDWQERRPQTGAEQLTIFKALGAKGGGHGNDREPADQDRG